MIRCQCSGRHGAGHQPLGNQKPTRKFEIKTYETKTYKTLCASAKDSGPLPLVGRGLVRGQASPRPHPATGKSSSVGFWR